MDHKHRSCPLSRVPFGVSRNLPGMPVKPHCGIDDEIRCVDDAEREHSLLGDEFRPDVIGEDQGYDQTNNAAKNGKLISSSKPWSI